MTNRDDQEEPGTETANISDGNSNSELELPDLDADDLELTGEKPASPEVDVQIDIDELDNIGVDEIDPDIIDISDEEVQQEFKKMEQEEQLASEPSKAASEPEANAEVQEELPDLLDTKDLKQEEEVEANDSTFESDMLDVEDDSDMKAQAKTGGRLSPKIIYGSLSATAVILAVILFVVFGADEAVIADASPTAAEPAIVTPTDEAPAAVAQAAIEVENVAVAEVVDELPPVAEAAIFADAQAELVEELEEEQEDEQEIVEPVATASTEILLAAAEFEPIDVQAAVDEQTAVVETPATGSSPATDVLVEPAVSTAATEVIAQQSASTSAPSEILTLSASNGNFYIIVASFLTESKAREQASNLLNNQDTPTILSPFGGSRRYRVAIAGYQTRAEVQANIAQFKSEYGNDIWPLRYISAGSTTLLSAATGNIYVIVSSFLTEELARKHADILAAEGENPSIIPPFAQGRQYRVAVSDYATLSAAQAALVQHREEFGNDAWLLRY